jgi:1-phosphofructokinase family hexose kinase
VTGFAAGDAGQAVIHGAREGGLALDAVRLRGTLRVCTLIIDPGRSETVVNEPGAEVGRRAVGALRRRIERYLPESTLLIVAGSLPPGMPAAFPAEVIRAAGSRPVILDTPGEAFRRGVAAGPAVAKLNRRELEATLDRPLTAEGEVVHAARDLLADGARAALVTLGPDGAILVAPMGAWRLTPPAVDRVNAVGAGDSLSAGLAAGLFQGRPLLDAVRLGMAAAASDVGTLLPGTIEPAQVEAFEEQVGVEAL